MQSGKSELIFSPFIAYIFVVLLPLQSKAMKNKLLFAAMLLIALAACKSSNKQDAVEIIDLPRVETPEAVSSAMDSYLKGVEAAQQDLHSIMVVQHGNVIYQKWLSEGEESKPHILNSVSKTLKWLFHEWIRIILLVAFLATILYSLIFVYSMCKWKGMNQKQEYEQALTDSSEYNHLPLSRPTNLIGAQRDEIEYEFGIAEREGFIRKYGGIREDGREYCIRVFYLPVVERVLWYETLIYIG